jgi:hypothetical protein
MFTKLLPLLTALVGMLIGLTRLRNNMELATLLLVAFGFVAGYTKPQNAWLWALLLGIWVPLAEFTPIAIGMKLSYRPDILAACVVLIPAFIGAYGGVAVRWMIEQSNKSKIDVK